MEHRQSPLAPMVATLSRHSPLTSEESEALVSLPHRLATLGRKRIVVREREVATYCCVLLSGFASRYKVAGSGAVQILSIHMRGDLIDLSSSMVETADHSIKALTNVDVAFIHRQSLIEVAQQFPGIAMAFLRETEIDGSIVREWLLNVGHRNSRARVAHLLCEMALRQEAAGICSGPNYEWPITQDQLGDATGITGIHVNRVFQTLRADRLIEMGTRSLTILDWEGLQVVGDFNGAYLRQGKGRSQDVFEV